MPKIDNEFIINAICGMQIGYSVEIPMMKRGLMAFAGDGHNESFEWKRYKLVKMTEDELIALYDEVYDLSKETRDRMEKFRIGYEEKYGVEP